MEKELLGMKEGNRMREVGGGREGRVKNPNMIH